ncbi:hypothetical protein PG989_016023 [Apiospora arundinis]|uniref:Uncharacterized protein n=1 Tax=Apiospora arundinis TaxID=335852 RepID=A0ABR2JH96_9PEZI
MAPGTAFIHANRGLVAKEAVPASLAIFLWQANLVCIAAEIDTRHPAVGQADRVARKLVPLLLGVGVLAPNLGYLIQTGEKLFCITEKLVAGFDEWAALTKILLDQLASLLQLLIRIACLLVVLEESGAGIRDTLREVLGAQCLTYLAKVLFVSVGQEIDPRQQLVGILSHQIGETFNTFLTYNLAMGFPGGTEDDMPVPEVADVLFECAMPETRLDQVHDDLYLRLRERIDRLFGHAKPLGDFLADIQDGDNEVLKLWNL